MILPSECCITMTRKARKNNVMHMFSVSSYYNSHIRYALTEFINSHAAKSLMDGRIINNHLSV